VTVLLFGFEPFLDFDENPSDLVVKRLDGRTVEGEQVVGRTLPVDYAAIQGRVLSELEAAKPSLVVSFGLSAGRDKVTLEKVAINYVNSKMKDNAGKIVEGVQISPGQPDARFASIPVEGLVAELGRQGIPAALSLSAGAYLCNYTMYVCLREAQKSGFRTGLIHVPCHSEWVARTGRPLASLPLQTIVRAAECTVSYLLREAAAKGQPV
jgi:pyroglutamyl-peptidase